MRFYMVSLCLVLFVVADAQAEVPNAVAPYVAFAETVWPGSPCSGKEQVDVARDVVGADGVKAWGLAYEDGSCRTVLEATLFQREPVEVCSIVVHELGHLAGYAHTNNTADVMYGGVLPPWRPCQGFILERSVTSAKRMTTPLAFDAMEYAYPGARVMCSMVPSGRVCELLYMRGRRFLLTLSEHRIIWHWVRPKPAEQHERSLDDGGLL